ncbi:MAG: SPOR domain-containing protein [Spirochaetota bacterium]
MKMRLCSLIALALSGLSLQAATWEGNGVVGASGEFRDGGNLAACNSFPRDSTVEIRNLENGKITRVVISGGIDNPGIFIVLSPKAAGELGMTSGISSRIRATSIAMFADSPASGTRVAGSVDPDFNPSLLATSGKAAQTGAKVAAASPAALPSSADRKASDPASSSGGKLFEPEKASVLSASGLAAPQAPAAALELADAQPTSIPGPEPASLSGIGTAPPAKELPAPPPLVDAAVPRISEGEKTGLADSESSKGAADSALASASVPPAVTSPEASASALAPEETTKVDASIPEATALADTSRPEAGPDTATLEPGIDLGKESPGINPPPAGTPALATEALPDALPGDPSGTTAETPQVAEAGTVESIVALEATAPRPPSGVSAAPAAGPAVAASRDTKAPEKAPIVAPVSTEPAKKIPAAMEAPAKPPASTSLIVEKLKIGAYYVQVGVYNSDATLTAAAGRFGSKFPVTAEKFVGKTGIQYRLYVGPIARDESGIMVIRLKALGYRDAFLRKVQ